MTEPVCGVYVEPVKTQVTAADAVRAFRRAARDMWGTSKPETIAILTAQSALESGRWESMWNFNPSNIKHSHKRLGRYTCIRLNEVLMRNGKRVVVWFDPVMGELYGRNGPAKNPNQPCELPPGHYQTRMRAFDTFAEGVSDKLDFLCWRRYAAAKEQAMAGDPSAYVHAVRAAGYFTANLKPYLRAVLSLYRTYLPIAKEQTADPEPLAPETEDQLCLDMAQCMRQEIPDWLRAKVQRLHSEVAVDWDAFDAARQQAVEDDDRW